VGETQPRCSPARAGCRDPAEAGPPTHRPPPPTSAHLLQRQRATPAARRPPPAAPRPTPHAPRPTPHAPRPTPHARHPPAGPARGRGRVPRGDHPVQRHRGLHGHSQPPDPHGDLQHAGRPL
jgi:hypothetical protein